MRKLPEVQEAKELMNEAIDWSFFKWMFEKGRVRETADRANDALDSLERAVKARWSDPLKAALHELSPKASRRHQKDQLAAQTADPRIRLLVEKVKEADEAARHARMDAEKTFDTAERELNRSLAQEGCKKAIHGWELHEKAIRKAEAAMESADEGA
jgi:type I site-specific restriction endonuclease